MKLLTLAIVASLFAVGSVHARDGKNKIERIAALAGETCPDGDCPELNVSTPFSGSVAPAYASCGQACSQSSARPRLFGKIRQFVSTRKPKLLVKGRCGCGG